MKMFNILRKTCPLYQIVHFSQKVARPLPLRKSKAPGNSVQSFVDTREFKAVGGKGGDGCISFLQLWSNENAGPDGGDGGHGGHVILQADADTRDLSAIPTVAKASSGEKGANKDCHGKNAKHLLLKVPIGTVIKNENGKVIGDLSREGTMFIAARGGAGGKGNHFFTTDTEQAPEVCEYGAIGENLNYQIEIKSMAHIGLIGFPNAGKSTLLRAISRARPKVAPYPFTTLKPYIGIIEYDDYEQIAVADLPGLIPDSHKNRGLGIQFLKHAERCLALVYVLDASLDEPWTYLDTLQEELSHFSNNLGDRDYLIVANKIDLQNGADNIEEIRDRTQLPVIPVSAKTGQNIGKLLDQIKIIYDRNKALDGRQTGS